jgi:hypothetical protein
LTQAGEGRKLRSPILEFTMANTDPKSAELKLDPDKLYLEEVLTDRRIGTLRRLTPVTRDGAPDATRAVSYVGETQILTPAGSIPIAFEIEAASLGDAAEKFGALAKEAIDRTVRELQELRRQASSSIVVPQGPLGGGGGKIQLP